MAVLKLLPIEAEGVRGLFPRSPVPAIRQDDASDVPEQSFYFSQGRCTSHRQALLSKFPCIRENAQTSENRLVKASRFPWDRHCTYSRGMNIPRSGIYQHRYSEPGCARSTEAAAKLGTSVVAPWQSVKRISCIRGVRLGIFVKLQ